jgi:hypothetical protein
MNRILEWKKENGAPGENFHPANPVHPVKTKQKAPAQPCD